jgi:hypothetical protein
MNDMKSSSFARGQEWAIAKQTYCLLYERMLRSVVRGHYSELNSKQTCIDRAMIPAEFSIESLQDMIHLPGHVVQVKKRHSAFPLPCSGCTSCTLADFETRPCHWHSPVVNHHTGRQTVNKDC